MGKIIAVALQKGGVGKTTTCINLAAYLAQLGKKVLIVDFDPQHNASSGVGVQVTDKTPSIYNVMSEQIDPTDAIQLTAVKGLEILPSNENLNGADVELAHIISGREKILRDCLNKIRDSYDYIFIDCPPTLTLLTVNALTAADTVIIPTQCEYFALEGITQLVRAIRLIKKQGLNPNIDIEGVLLTMFSRNGLNLQVQAELLKFFGRKLYNVQIPRNVRLAEAPSYGKPICLYDNKCPGAKAYRELAFEFMKRQPE
ncbi:MAG: AAA family ATPase [Clostridia bacterium]|jgi:chromosome partitioning protein|nr:AAA family ATPase [Clostridia bacterium]